MRRRALLSATVAGLSSVAGCNGFLDGSDRSDRDPYGVPTTATATATSTVGSPTTRAAIEPPVLSGDGTLVVRSDSLPRAEGLEPAVELATGPRTYALPQIPSGRELGLSVGAGFLPPEEGPPTLVVSVTNEQSEAITRRTDRMPMLTTVLGEHLPGTEDDPGVTLGGGAAADPGTTTGSNGSNSSTPGDATGSDSSTLDDATGRDSPTTGDLTGTGSAASGDATGTGPATSGDADGANASTPEDGNATGTGSTDPAKPDPPSTLPNDGDTPTGPGLVLLPSPGSGFPVSSATPFARDPYWTLEAPPGEWFPDRIRIEPDVTLRAPFRVVGSPDLDGRPTGVYRFGTGPTGFRVVVWHSDRPGPTGRSRFEDDSTPELPSGSVGWFHAADSSRPAFLRPGREAVDLPAAVEFTFYNRSTAVLRCGEWQLFKRERNDWFRVFPIVSGGPCFVIRPGVRVPRTLRASGGPLDGEEPGAMDVGHLGGGRYAVTVGFGRGTDYSGALLDVAADPAEVVPEPTVETTSRGETVFVTSPRIQNAPGEPARVTVSRFEGSVETEYIAEQLMQPPLRVLRNAIPFFEDGVERVVLSTDEVPILALGTFRFRGRNYRVSIPED